MRLARASIALLLVTAVCLGYAADCAALTAKESMQCCRSMRCPSHHHQSGECCKTMPFMRATLGQLPALQAHSVSHVWLGMAVTRDASSCSESFYTSVSLNSHGPPGSSPTSVLALRI